MADRLPTATLRLDVAIEAWPLRAPFRITGHVFTAADVVVVALSDGVRTGRGEAAGVYYRGETPAGIVAALERVRAEIERGLTQDEIQDLLPPGGARNALDCALWDLRAQQAGISVARLAGLAPPTPLVTTFTVPADTPATMAQGARAFADALAIKIKLLGDGADDARIRAVRAARPEVFLAVDANQGLEPETLRDLRGALADCKVGLLEQPFPADAAHDERLAGLDLPCPTAADESALTRRDLPRLRGLVDTINIKLDKTGGLTEALAMRDAARQLGFRVMVGNMTGTSLAIAPAMLVGQSCDVVDLDGPVFLARDRSPGIAYRDGRVSLPTPFWGGLHA